MADTSLNADGRFVEALELFDAGEYFACHDVLEELWSERLDEHRSFLQGLIHAAVALFHFEEGNLGGARKMYDSTVNYLSPYLPVHEGLDVGRFLEMFHSSFQPLLEVQSGYPSHIRLNTESRPTLMACQVSHIRKSRE